MPVFNKPYDLDAVGECVSNLLAGRLATSNRKPKVAISTETVLVVEDDVVAS